MRLKGQWLSIGLVVFLMSLGLTACNRNRSVEAAREDQTPAVTPFEQDFMMKASQANMAEIEMARDAMRKTDNTDVKDFANMIQTDHSRNLEDLTDMMKDKRVSQPKSLSADMRQDIDRMNNLTGPEFDREFVNMMVMDHQKAVELFRDAENTAQTSEVKDYVEDTLPKLEMHLDKAQQLQSKLFSAPNRQPYKPVR
jgi:putative membrane protein